MLEEKELTELSENDLEDVTGGGGLIFGKIVCPTYIWYDCTNPSCGLPLQQPAAANSNNCGHCNSPMKVRYVCPQCGSKMVNYSAGNISCYDCQTVTHADGNVQHY